MKNALAMLMILWFVAGCSLRETSIAAARTRPTAGSRVAWRGIAENHMVGAYLSGPGIYVDLPNNRWPPEVVGKPVDVQGTIVERHDLPLFIADPNDPIAVQGIPVPPGTDLHEASKRFILERVTWTTFGDRG